MKMRPSQDEQIEKEVLKEVIAEPEVIIKETPKEFNTENMYENPYIHRKHQSAEAEMQDRLLTIEGRPPNAPWGSLWITNSQFREQVALTEYYKV